MQHRLKEIRPWQSWEKGFSLLGLLCLSDGNWISECQLAAQMLFPASIPTVSTLGLVGVGVWIDQAMLVNLLFGLILLGSVYGLGCCLFSVPVGLRAIGFCLLTPGLYPIRPSHVIDYALAAIVTLCFFCLTLWRVMGNQSLRHEADNHRASGDRLTFPSSMPLPLLAPWLLTAAVGTALGLVQMLEPAALLLLLVPLVWIVIETLWQRAWGQLVQLVLVVGLSLAVSGAWYRPNGLLTNGLLNMAGGKRTIDAIIVAPQVAPQPLLSSLGNWAFHLKALPGMISLPLLLVSVIGFLFFWRRSRVGSLWAGDANYSPKPKAYCQQIYRSSQRSLAWLLAFGVGGSLLSSLHFNQDMRAVLPCLSILAVVLAYGFTLVPKRWRLWKWGTVALAAVLLIATCI